MPDVRGDVALPGLPADLGPRGKVTAVSVRLRVWTWYCYEPSLGQPLAFAAAVYRVAELRAMRARLRLAEPAMSTRLHPAAPGFRRAAAAPLRVWWMPLESFARRSAVWLSEEQLTAARGHLVPALPPSA